MFQSMKNKTRRGILHSHFINDESGNVLLFTIICLLFLVFISSLTSIAITNRVSLVRKASDNNQVNSIVDQKNAAVENSIVEILNQNDELTRYYVSQLFYDNITNDFSGSNADLDSYLNKLIGSNFQAGMANKVASGDLDERNLIADVLYTYLCIRRLNANSSGLSSYSEKVSSIGDSSLTGTSILGSDAFDTVYRAAVLNNDVEIVALKTTTTIPQEKTNSIREIDTSSLYYIYPYKYIRSGENVKEPKAEEFIEKTLSTKQYVITTKP